MLKREVFSSPGLSIAKKLVEPHGGFPKIESKLRSGTTRTITLSTRTRGQADLRGLTCAGRRNSHRDGW